MIKSVWLEAILRHVSMECFIAVFPLSLPPIHACSSVIIASKEVCGRMESRNNPQVSFTLAFEKCKTLEKLKEEVRRKGKLSPQV